MKRIDIGPLHIALGWEWGEESDQLGPPVRIPDTAVLFGWPDWAAEEREGMRFRTTRNIQAINVPVEQQNGTFGTLVFRRTTYATVDGATVFDSGSA